MNVPFNDLRPAIEPIAGDIINACARVADSGWYLRGGETEAFEEEWAAYCGQRFCVACANGTDAITLAAKALKLKRARVPAITAFYTAMGLERAGCEVIAGGEIDSAGRLAQPGRQCVAVPLYGTDPSEVERWACTLFDAAQAHGWKPPAHAVTCWSFYPTKNLGAMGDCGAVTCNDEGLAQELRVLAGRDDVYRSPEQIVSRCDELQAAILRVKLRRLDDWIEQRRQIARRYWHNGVKLVHLPEESRFHLLVIRDTNRDAMADHLRTRGVGTKIHYATPIHKLPGRHDGVTLPEAEKWCAEILSVPCYPGMTHEAIDYVCECIHDFHSSNRHR